MAITIYNQTDNLFTKALGKDWMEQGLRQRTPAELAVVASLAADHAGQTLTQLEALGRALGLSGGDHALDIETANLGWLIATLAEHANVCLEMGESARCLQSPKLRKLLTPEAVA